MDWKGLSPHDLDMPGERNVAAMYAVTYARALPYTVLFVLLWGVYFLVLRSCLGAEICKIRTGTWALKLMMLTHHSVITPLALLSMWEDPVIRRLYLCFGCSEAAVLMNRASEISLAASALTPVTLGYFVADLVLLSQWQLTKGSKLEQYLMLTHHVASLLVWPAAIYFDWVARYVIIMLSYEMTSLLLTLLWMISAAGYKRSMAYGIIGLLFTSLFVVLRMIGAVPQLIGMYNAPPWSEELMQKLTGRVLHDYASLFSRSLVLPHLMNLFWGVKVVEGALSTFAGKKKTK